MIPFIFGSHYKGPTMQVTLIHNPDAGDDQQPSGDELLELIRRAGHTASYQSSKDENWHSALEQSCDIVAVAGGDGIVGAVAKQLIRRRGSLRGPPFGDAEKIATP